MIKARMVPLSAMAMLMGMGTAMAQDNATGPYPWQMKMQAPVTAVMEYTVWFGWYTIAIMTAIVLLVVALIAWCIFKYNERSNPVPSRTSHNTLIEVIWTVAPVLILVAIAIPSFRLLYAQYDPSKIYADFDPETDRFLNLKVTGYQWYWGVEYSADEESQANGVSGEIGYDILMVPDADLGDNGIRNLSVDNPIVVPVDTYVRVQVTAGDVLHSFAMPPFGVKIDAVPGRLNETYFKAEREGIYYGQCSELCGKDHAFMPIAVRVVSQDQFRAWAGSAGEDLQGAYQTLARMIDAGEDEKVAAR